MQVKNEHHPEGTIWVGLDAVQKFAQQRTVAGLDGNLATGAAGKIPGLVGRLAEIGPSS